MSTSLVLCIGPLILILCELTSPIGCTDYDTKCYPVANRSSVCFFRPHFNYTWVTWYSATAACRRSSASLVFIPDKATQDAFEEYINSLMHKYSDDLWMAGRVVRNKDWTWTNGQPFNESAQSTNDHPERNTYHVQAILTNDLEYRYEYLGNRHHYVCQFFGDACQAKDSIVLKNGCVMLNDMDTLDLYEARNKCVERGGDLPVIAGQEDRDKFRQVFSKIRNATKTGLWLGLRRQWWMWNVTDAAEVKYSNWLLDNGFKPDGRCMVVELNDYQWKQDNCSDTYRRFICQTGPAYVESATTPAPFPVSGLLFFVTGTSVMVLTIIFVIVVVAVMAKKRRARFIQPRIDTMPRDASYQQLQQYTELQPTTKTAQLPTIAGPLRPQQTEQIQDDVYDDIVEIRAPNYLEVIH